MNVQIFECVQVLSTFNHAAVLAMSKMSDGPSAKRGHCDKMKKKLMTTFLYHMKD